MVYPILDEDIPVYEKFLFMTIYICLYPFYFLKLLTLAMKLQFN